MPYEDHKIITDYPAMNVTNTITTNDLEVAGDLTNAGITWTSRVAAENNGWNSVCYGNGLFVAVASNGTNTVMTSPDGITWTARTAAEANYWYSVCYGNGLFVAVGGIDSGTNPVMTSGKSLYNVIPTKNIYQGGMTVQGTLAASGIVTSPSGVFTTIVGGVSTLTYGSTIACNMSLANTFTLTATGNATINAVGGTAGQSATFIITNDATLPRTITFGTNFKTNGPIIGIVSKIATILFTYNGTIWIEEARWKESQTRVLDLEIEAGVPWADGGSNSGIMSLNYDSVNFRNYLRWTSASITQDYDYIFCTRVPDSFSTFPSGALSVDVRMTDKTNDIGTVTMSNTTGVVDAGVSGAPMGSGLTNAVWGTYTDTPTATYAPGDYVKVQFHLGNNAANDTIDIARVNLVYIPR
jgi:hypothetical protein